MFMSGADAVALAVFQRELWDREENMPREVVEYFKERIKDIQCGNTGVKQQAVAYDDDDKADRVAIIRTFWVLLHIATCLFIIIGNGRTLGVW